MSQDRPQRSRRPGRQPLQHTNASSHYWQKDFAEGDPRTICQLQDPNKPDVHGYLTENKVTPIGPYREAMPRVLWGL